MLYTKAGVILEEPDICDTSRCNNALIVILKYFNIMFVHTEHLFIMFTLDFSSENATRETGNSFSYAKSSHSLTMCICIKTLVFILWVYKGDTEMIESERSFSYDKKKKTQLCMCQKWISVQICIYTRNIQLHERSLPILIIAKYYVIWWKHKANLKL